MIVSNFALIKKDGTIRAEATYSWEQKDRPPFTLFVQTSEVFETLISADPNSFLRAGILNAWHYNEHRIRVDGVICPLLANNLEGAFLLLKKWYPEDFGPSPNIESSVTFKPLTPANNYTISLFSGGVDSVCLLRSNRLFYPNEHPNYIKSVISVEFSKTPAAHADEFNELVTGRLMATKDIVEDAQVTPIPVVTNIWWLNPDGYFYGQKSYGSQLMTVASFFSKGFYRGFIASSYDAGFSHKPWGSHPQLDAYFSSSDFKIEHVGTEMTRLEKIKLLTNWPIGFNNLRVCQNDNTGSSNCGTCEKCIRTQLMLEALGKLKECRSFPKNTVNADLISYLETYDMLYCTDKVHNEEKLSTYGNIAHLLEKRGRLDLAKPLKDVLAKLAERHAGEVQQKNVN